jgi:hypothetical protein
MECSNLGLHLIVIFQPVVNFITGQFFLLVPKIELERFIQDCIILSCGFRFSIFRILIIFITLFITSALIRVYIIFRADLFSHQHLVPS